MTRKKGILKKTFWRKGIEENHGNIEIYEDK